MHRKLSQVSQVSIKALKRGFQLRGNRTLGLIITQKKSISMEMFLSENKHLFRKYLSCKIQT